MVLENRLYTEQELIDINAETPLTPLEYYTHHEDLKSEYEEFCKEHGYTILSSEAADEFFEHRFQEEQRAEI